MQRLNRRLNPDRLRAKNAIADRGALPAPDCGWTRVEIQDLELATAQHVDGSTCVRSFLRFTFPFSFASIAPPGIEDPAIVRSGGEDRDG